jgi:D-glycero-alpha-D-manno-heptose-7-phosphate kinase
MIITKTPLRVGLLGGGSDLPDFYKKYGCGLCINFTIDKYVYVIVKKRFDDYIYLKYSDNEIVHKNNINEIKHDFIRETLNYLDIDFGLEIINFADIPTKGTGLGSSSSFLVGLLHALYIIQGVLPDKEQLVDDACYIETIRCNKPIGYQDQIAAVYGGLNACHFYSEPSFNESINYWVENINYIDIQDDILLYYTNITRESKDILSQQKNNIYDDVIFNNMVKNVQIAKQGLHNLIEGNHNSIGNLLDENWKLKKTFSLNVSNNELDNIYNFALSSGAIGGKITGAGGGGFFVFYVPKKVQHHFKENFKIEYPNLREMPFKIDSYGSRVLLNVEQEKW